MLLPMLLFSSLVEAFREIIWTEAEFVIESKT